jgi:hypothetical protein
MIFFGWIKRLLETKVRLRLLDREVEERINGLAAPIKTGGSDTQIQASIAALNDVTQTVKYGDTGTVRRKV